VIHHRETWQGIAPCLGCGRGITGDAHECDVCEARYLCSGCEGACCPRMTIALVMTGSEIQTCLARWVGIVLKHRSDGIEVDFGEHGDRVLHKRTVVRVRRTP